MSDDKFLSENLAFAKTVAILGGTYVMPNLMFEEEYETLFSAACLADGRVLVGTFFESERIRGIKTQSRQITVVFLPSGNGFAV